MAKNEGKAIPFITFSQNDGFEITQDAKNFLSNLDNSKLGILSVVGKYRTGKSFLINRVLLNKINNGFDVGPTINACTKVYL